MIKAATPVVMLFVSWMLGVANPTLGSIVNILIIVGGVVMASAGELEFSWIGVAFQFAGILFEATRVVLIQIMLSGEGIKMDPMVGLYYYAPVCAAINFLVACVVELPYFTLEKMTNSDWTMLILSAPIAFFLNYTSMALVRIQSSHVEECLKALTCCRSERRQALSCRYRPSLRIFCLWYVQF